MATSTFILKDAQAQSETLIFLIIRENGARLKFSTDERIHPSKWDKKTRLVDLSAADLTPSEKKINTQLASYSKAFDLLNSTAKIEDKPLDLNYAREYLNKKFTTRPQAKPLNFLDFARGFMASSTHKKSTIKAYAIAIQTLENYEKAKRKGKALTFEDITLDFYNAFVNYCKSLGYANNTIGNRVKNTKVFIGAAFERGLHTNVAFKSKKFEVLKEDVNNIYLTEEELKLIYKANFSKSAKLDKVRDLFLVACRTGLRFSDLRRLTADKIEDGLITIKNQKTGIEVYIPLHHQTREILDKYSHDLPRVLSNQKFNEYLKDVAKLAGIKGTTTLTKTQGGELVETILPKHKLVTVHTARRTFATLAYKAGVPKQSIMKITGHSTEKSFDTYLKMTDLETAKETAKHDFFQPQPLKIVS